MPWKLTVEGIPEHEQPLGLNKAFGTLPIDNYTIRLTGGTLTVDGPYAHELGALVDKLCIFLSFDRLVMEHIPREQP